jgi:DNA (cytosine-5)-methyltransferase 1
MRKLSANTQQHDWMIVDNFAGGGGASTGIEMAVGRSPSVAINHDPEALAMHKANHPFTRHYEQNVWDIDPRVVVRNRKVGLAWFSPDCTGHSKARGGKPIRHSGKRSRSLGWVVIKWASHVKPRVIILENVEEWQQWGPVVRKKDENGEPISFPDGSPWYVQCDRRKGSTVRRWVRMLRNLGYAVEWKELRACDYGAPTVRKRLFVIARCDGQKIVWPVPTHGKPESAEVLAGTRNSWRTAAEIIDWSIPCPSIFLTREEGRAIGVNRPLAENTMNRIAAGLKRYVLNAAKPFIVTCNHGGDWFRGRGLDVPMPTVTGSKGDALVSPFLQPYHGPTSDGAVSRSIEMQEPVKTLDTSNRFGVVAPFLGSPAHSKTTGRGKNVWSPEEPLPTTTSSNDKCVIAPVMTYAQQGGAVKSPQAPVQTLTASRKDQNALVQAFMVQHNTGVVGHPATKPLSTITGRGTQQQIVEATFASSGEHRTETASFMMKYYSEGGQHSDCREPMHTVPTRDRMGLVTVDGIDFQIVDIGMRMLTSRELFRAQGFPDSYVIDCLAPNKKGKLRPLPKDAQVRMCGNSVCPNLAAALVSANCQFLVDTKPQKRDGRQLELAGI